MYAIPFYFATSSFFILFGVLFRTYSMGIFMGLLTLCLYIDLFQDENAKIKIASKRYWWLAVTAGLALFTDYSNIWPVGSILLFSLIHRTYRNFSSLAILAGVFLNLPWILLSLVFNFQTILNSKKNVLQLASGTDFLTTLTYFFDLKFLLQINKNFIFLTVMALVLGVWGIVLYYKKNPTWAVFFLISVIVPNLISVSFSLVYSPVFDLKNMWFSNLFLFIGILLFFVQLKNLVLRRLALVIFVACQILTLNLSTVQNAYGLTVYKTSAVKKAFEYVVVAENGNPATIFLSNVDWHSVPSVYKRWYFPNAPIDVKKIKPDSGLQTGESAYFFDLENDSNNEQLAELGRKLSCTFHQISELIPIGVLKKCIP